MDDNNGDSSLEPFLTSSDKNALDPLKGFAHLESFSELLAWSEDGIDTLQKSNTPLIPRSIPATANSQEASPKILLIHDYAGGYNDYEACQGATVEKEMYSCEYLQHVEAFVYFSHKLVSIPPPSWINLCHRNGVRVLGTFLVEPGSQEAESILEQDEVGSFWVAQRLVDIAACYGFDGWLVNIEIRFSVLTWKTEKLENFLRQLQAGGGMVVWYDALTTLNFVWYQNTLNYLNLTFALAAGSMLTNYAWTPELAKTGRDHALSSGLGLENLYFGIDVWAQNVQRGPNKRITYPIKGGGGTGTGLGIKALKDLGLNAGIFAPGWSFEHFHHHNRDVERTVWEGGALPADLTCDCAPEKPHEVAAGLHSAIIEHVAPYPAGSSTFFHTDFERAFSRSADGSLRAHLNSQSILPLIETRTNIGQVTSPEECPGAQLMLASPEAPPRLRLLESFDSKEVQYISMKKLIDLGVTFDQPFKIEIKYRLRTEGNWNVALATEYQTCAASTSSLWKLSRDDGDEVSSLVLASEDIARPAPAMSTSLTCLGIHFQCDDGSQLAARRSASLDIYSISVLPREYVTPPCHIENVRLRHRRATEHKPDHIRLTWDIRMGGAIDLQTLSVENMPQTEMRTSGMPMSNITGPCAYFQVELDGQRLGRAYALAFVLSDESLESLDDSAAHDVLVTGIGFDAQVVCQVSTKLELSSVPEEEDWVMVSSTWSIRSTES